MLQAKDQNSQTEILNLQENCKLQKSSKDIFGS